MDIITELRMNAERLANLERERAVLLTERTTLVARARAENIRWKAVSDATGLTTHGLIKAAKAHPAGLG